MAITPRQPDITYHPDFLSYQQRTEKLRPLKATNGVLPVNFPAQLSSPLVWEGQDFPDEKEWTFNLNTTQLEEIDKALAYFKSLSEPIGYVNQSTFPLPLLSPLLRKEAQALQSGRGFFVIRGLRPEKHSIEDNIIIYAGVSSYIGSTRGRQDNKVIDGVKKSNMLNHIKDLSRTSAATNIGAPAYTTDKQVFHTDAGDIVSLFCLSPAAKGGESKLASSWRVYNELARTRPDIIRTLSEDWAFDGYGNPAKPYTNRPLLFYSPKQGLSPERLIIHQDIPPITEEQAEALDALHFLAERFSLTLDFQKGDIQFINNLALFHARDGFVDELGNERHLLRLWLRDSELAWETPVPLQERWDELYKDVTEEEQVFSLEPKIRGGAGKS